MFLALKRIITQKNWITCTKTLFFLIGIAAGVMWYRQSLNYYAERFLFDTEVYIEAHGHGAGLAVQEALRCMEDLNKKLNNFSPTSEISLINNAAGSKPVAVSAATFDAIRESVDMARITGGAFDPTVGPLVKLWGIGSEGKHNPTPTSEEIGDILPLVDFNKVILNPQNRTVYLPDKGMELDLGALVKGYAVKQAVNILQQNKITSALVAAGGNIYALGYKPNGKPWRIGIRHPRQSDTEIGYLELVNQAIDTAGDYERYYQEQGIKYAHILDPRSGYPVTFTASSSVIADDPVIADALATGLFVLGANDGLALIGKITSAAGLIITANGDLNYSPNLKGKFVAYSDSDKDSRNNKKMLVIKLNGREVRRLALTGTEKEYYLKVPLNKGEAIIEINAGRVRVLPMDKELCPDQICSRTGWISRPGQSIICLPNRLVLEIID